MKVQSRLSAKHKAFYDYAILLIAVIVVIFLFILSISFGAVSLSIKEVISALFGNHSGTAFRIVFAVRLPRSIVSVLCGAALAVAGCILQCVMHNPLATPNIIGVSSGAGLTALTIMILLPQYFYLVPPTAFLGAMITTLLIYSLAWKGGTSSSRLILAGVAVNSILAAGNDILLSYFPDRVTGVIGFLIGGLSGVDWNDVKMIFPYIFITSCISLGFANALNILSLGDNKASSLGINVNLTKFVLIILSSMLAGSSVSAVGLLGFVGLIIPHITRLLVGEDHKILLPLSLLMGAGVLLACDLVARLIFRPTEIPVGIIMAIIGGPFFIWILRNRKKNI